jgi:hypothetical protein
VLQPTGFSVLAVERYISTPALLPGQEYRSVSRSTAPPAIQDMVPLLPIHRTEVVNCSCGLPRGTDGGLTIS